MDIFWSMVVKYYSELVKSCLHIEWIQNKKNGNHFNHNTINKLGTVYFTDHLGPHRHKAIKFDYH